ncbi:MAG: hypothetical protein HXS48_05465 [Theionarchaea archaeon]|nr:hypothetical protein [Theionarchaea archaeon]
MNTKVIVNIRSMNVLKQHAYYPPVLKIETELENLGDDLISIDRILFKIDVRIGDSRWTIGNFWQLERKKVEEKVFTRLTTECPVDFEMLKRINDKVQSQNKDIEWEVRTTFYFDDQTSQEITVQGDSSNQKPPWTPKSTWEKWYSGWENLSMPAPYSLIENLQSILHKAESGLQDLGKERSRVEKISETLSVLQRMAGERDRLETEKEKLTLRIARLEEVSRDFSHLINIGNTIGVDENWIISACALSLIEVMVNKKLDELGEKKEGDFRKRLNRLVEQVKKKEGREVGKIMLDIFYSARNKVLHGGGVPTEDEKRKIVDFVGELADKLWGE